MWSHTTFAADSTSSWEERRGWTTAASPGERKRVCVWVLTSWCVLPGQRGFPSQPLDLFQHMLLMLVMVVSAPLLELCITFFFFLEMWANCRVGRLFNFFVLKVGVWVRVVVRRLCVNVFCSFPLTRSSTAVIPVVPASLHHHIHPSHVSIPLPVSALFRVFLPLRVIIFPLAAASCVLVFSPLFLVLHCVSVSGVTSVVLPYGRWHHAVLPQGRTTDGMLEGVCVHTSVHPHLLSWPPDSGGCGGVLGSGGGACALATGGPSVSLTCICLSVLFIFFSSTTCTDPSLYVLLIYLCVRSWSNVWIYLMLQ